jgi:glutamate 5-kinase
MAGGTGGALGRGGMITKVRAARVAARSGADTVIVGGRIDDALLRIAAGENLGTFLWAEQQPQAARKRWISGQLQTRGTIVLDDGAARVVREQGKSILPVGVKEVRGDFTRGDMVICEDLNGKEIARGYQDDNELIHRDNLVLS